MAIQHIRQLFIEMKYAGLTDSTFEEYRRRVIATLVRGDTIIAAVYDDGALWIDAFMTPDRPPAGVARDWLLAVQCLGLPIRALASDLYIRQWLRLTGFGKNGNVYEWKG